MEERAARSAQHASGAPPETATATSKRAVNNIVCRTKFLDDLIMHLTGAPAPVAAPAAAHLDALRRRAASSSVRHTAGWDLPFSQVRASSCLLQQRDLIRNHQLQVRASLCLDLLQRRDLTRSKQLQLPASPCLQLAALRHVHKYRHVFGNCRCF